MCLRVCLLQRFDAVLAGLDALGIKYVVNDKLVRGLVSCQKRFTITSCLPL